MKNQRITQPHDGFVFFRRHLKKTTEEFWIASLDADKKVTSASCLFRGTVDRCLFHPRDVFRYLCRKNASSFIVAHNHPSGNVRPSQEDILATHQLLVLSMIHEIPLVDHLILGPKEYYSFLENGDLKVETKDPLAPFCR